MQQSSTLFISASESGSAGPVEALYDPPAKVLSLAIVDPNGEANLSQYDSCLFHGLQSGNLNLILITSHHFASQSIPEHKVLRIYNYKRFKGQLSKAVSYLFSNLKLYRVVISNRIDIVHFQWFKLPTVDWVGLLLLRFLAGPLKIVFTAHNVLPHDTGAKHFSGYKRLYRTVDAIIVHTSRSKEELVQKFGVPESKIRVIPHGILYPKSAKGEGARPSCLPSKIYNYPHVATILGRINRYKGHDRAITAWKNSSISSNGTWLLVIAGEGEEAYLRELREWAGASRNILIISRFLDNAEFAELSTKSSLSILPYREISQSGALLTSLAFAKPFVACDVGGLSDPLGVADVGWAFNDSEFTERLTALLDQLSVDEGELYEKARNSNGWKAIWQEYSWSNIGRQTLSLYKSITNRAPQITLDRRQNGSTPNSE